MSSEDEIRAAADRVTPLPPKPAAPKDANDVLQSEGTAGVQAMIDSASPAAPQDRNKASSQPRRAKAGGKKGGGKGGGGGTDGGGSGEWKAGSSFIQSLFFMDDRGLWHKPYSGDGKSSQIHVCDPVKVLARTRDAAGENWGSLIAWSDGDGRQHEWAVPRGMLAGDGVAIREYLLQRGLYIAPGKAAREALMMWLSSLEPKEAALSVEQVGWHEGSAGLAFVLPDAVYGPQGGERIILQAISRVGHNFDQAGVLEDWQREIAAPAAGNTRLLLAIAAGFAAPLLRLTGEESGGINFLGQSRTGKSTAVFIGAGVWGRGARGGYVRQWRATANGLESVAAAHSDALLPLDEMGQMDPREIGEAAYLLANESGKSRATREGAARHAVTWRVFILSSGENSIGELAQEGGRKAKVGQEVRIVDVPADAGGGMGLFEELHGSSDSDAFSRRLRDAAGRFYGTPARAFLTALTSELESNRSGVMDWIEAHRAEFISKTVQSEATGQVRSVAGRFALISAAGELATRWGVTGWEPGVARWAAALCFRAWLNNRGTVGAKEDELAIRQVRQFIEENGSAQFSHWPEKAALDPNEIPTDEKTIYRAGFKRYSTDDEAWHYYVMPEVWSSKVCRGFSARHVAKVLAERGYLRPASQGKFSQSLTVPGHGKQRLYHILPAILGDHGRGDAD
ncbi:DUF927 domain-containing protein [Dongia sp.]|uniref:DUF927 domain-containing protein n=1 Tax=Dongia sp. TaxID=1977262 RepID=UPI00375303F2